MLLDRAIWHRRLAWILTIIAILFTLFAAWEATKAALGKNLLQNFDLLRNQQAIIAAERLKLETSLDKPADEAALRDQLNMCGGAIARSGGKFVRRRWTRRDPKESRRRQIVCRIFL